MRLTEEEYKELIERRGGKISSSSSGKNEKKPSKYHNRKCSAIDPKTGEAVTFDSEKERDYYFDLLFREKYKSILDVRRQVRFKIIEPFEDIRGNKYRGIDYVADFTYIDAVDGSFHIVDVKGYRTDVYRIKKKLLAHMYGYIIDEV